jgi:hypothetical protein
MKSITLFCDIKYYSQMKEVISFKKKELFFFVTKISKEVSCNLI